MVCPETKVINQKSAFNILHLEADATMGQMCVFLIRGIGLPRDGSYKSDLPTVKHIWTPSFGIARKVLAAGFRPDLFIAEFNLLGGKGPDIMKMAGEQFQHDETYRPSLIVTTTLIPSEVASAYCETKGIAVERFLAKPFDVDILLDTINKIRKEKAAQIQR
ncbi:MAG: hypothetical protein ACD_38C00172G0002 [uncultured bacterium]|uniref:Response regulatory domain-containing protein n=1 Tax=Candidatus Daviesbacteria bacterium GW2011_GWC2_40_12 TaxID=1618431 RepID=A0A0G0QQE4_9BACT|nr:MAG: hypothetical protein ACD_38C00172G0002 [uncultured bacterium]KKQ85809.1 MAG: hypothetical protein UT04_C0001G0021 [Candidatus Daviesbacteria bacterium GW2011_GWF2_38_7]KKR16856.1 MAG: hypothetical protein UT45_C0004G0187 [Candidatus Daviesbacteria bacterium GW2011_GWA2_39_33]KKR22766.1 MAG: hypothetical protein UT54_C0062G0005 [Candidatus Daviesbacteria bacterium GW2011_GWB1_39_5]KKR42363.1 MAG: hypothetical protein UT77_C0002G0016 [Candidatus Daviesbacteria bacterium GW2011_GWC2_40_12]